MHAFSLRACWGHGYHKLQQSVPVFARSWMQSAIHVQAQWAHARIESLEDSSIGTGSGGFVRAGAGAIILEVQSRSYSSMVFVRRLRSALVVAWALFVSHGCGDAADGTAGADGAATAADIASWCDAICDYEERCPDEDVDPADELAPCRTECPAEAGAITRAGLVKQSVARAFERCARELACDQSEDVCAGQVVAELDLDIDAPLVNQCIQVQDECGGFSDDSCLYAVTATSAGMARLDECFSSDCDRVGECIQALTN